MAFNALGGNALSDPNSLSALPINGLSEGTVITSGGGSPPVPLTPPNPSLSLFGITVSRIGSGTSSTFTTDYSPTTARAALSPVNTFYVDKTTGNNNNDGLSTATPFRSIDLAVKMVADTGVLGCVKVKGEVAGQPRPRYLSTATQARSGQPTNNATWKDALVSTFTDAQVIIEPWNDGELFDSWLSVNNVTWTVTADPNIWKNSSQGNVAFDYANLDRMNAPRKLAQITLSAGTSEADAIIALNNAYTLYSGLSDLGGPTYALGVIVRVTSTATYIRLFDNRTPNSDSNLQFAATTTGVKFLTSAKSPILFLTGLGLGGAANGAIFCQGTSANHMQINTNYCRFLSGIGAGAFTANGATSGGGCDVISYMSCANGGGADGWNYHDTCSFYEINCGGDWNGWSGTPGTNNGTTCHESCLGVRVNGSYLNNEDRSIHDVSDSLTWNLGVTSSTRRGADGTAQSTPFATGIESTSGTSKMWLDTCQIANGPSGAPQYTTESNYTNTILYYANLNFTPVVGPSSTPGTVTTYTP